MFLPPLYHQPDDAEVSAALDGLALDYNDPVETGLAAVERLACYQLRREDVDRIEAAHVGYRIRHQSGEPDEHDAGSRTS